MHSTSNTANRVRTLSLELYGEHLDGAQAPALGYGCDSDRRWKVGGTEPDAGGFEVASARFGRESGGYNVAQSQSETQKELHGVKRTARRGLECRVLSGRNFV